MKNKRKYRLAAFFQHNVIALGMRLRRKEAGKLLDEINEPGAVQFGILAPGGQLNPDTAESKRLLCDLLSPPPSLKAIYNNMSKLHLIIEDGKVTHKCRKDTNAIAYQRARTQFPVLVVEVIGIAGEDNRELLDDVPYLEDDASNADSECIGAATA